VGFLERLGISELPKAPHQLQQDIKTAIGSIRNRVLKCTL
jgi:hypothetical protein